MKEGTHTRIPKHLFYALIIIIVISVVFNIRSIAVAQVFKTNISKYNEENEQLLKDYNDLISDNEELRKEGIRKERLYARTLSEKELSEMKRDELLLGLLDAKDGLDENEAKSEAFTAENNSLQEQIIKLESENAGLKSVNASLQKNVNSVGIGYKPNTFESTVPVSQSSPSIVSPANSFNVKTASTGWFTMEATYYGPDCKGCTGITKTGIDVRNTIYSNGYRIIAVDPSLIKLGSILEVKTPNETFEAIAGDIGGDIKGSRIDILVESDAAAKPYGRHNVQLRILD